MRSLHDVSCCDEFLSKKSFCQRILLTRVCLPFVVCAADKVLMLFGKVTKNRFTLDFRPPMTVTKALSVALSTFADKLAVT